uniref:Uncharacterized protein n=1 Tax=Anopheles culicifacies TaxID=139723 RepID=A0A182MMX3_9DIPT
MSYVPLLILSRDIVPEPGTFPQTKVEANLKPLANRLPCAVVKHPVSTGKDITVSHRVWVLHHMCVWVVLGVALNVCLARITRSSYSQQSVGCAVSSPAMGTGGGMGNL